MDRSRTMMNFFLEHRFYLFNKSVDITPDLWQTISLILEVIVFPVSTWDGKSALSFAFIKHVDPFRIPTFTDLYYSDRTTLGNANLKPEEAISNEVGFVLLVPKVSLSFLPFLVVRPKNLIDYVKNNQDDSIPFKAENIQQVNTSGIDLNFIHRIPINTLTHEFKINYSYLENNLKTVALIFP